MSFTQISEAFCARKEAALAEAAQKPQKKAESPMGRPATRSLEGLPKMSTPPAMPEKSRPDLAAKQASTQAQLAALRADTTPSERRKLAALAKAGKSGTSVLDTFKVTREGDLSAAFANPADIRKGLKLAKKEKLDLDASW